MGGAVLEFTRHTIVSRHCIGSKSKELSVIDVLEHVKNLNPCIMSLCILVFRE